MQAEDRAENATAHLEEILQKTRNNWMPLWLEEHYQKVCIVVSPVILPTMPSICEVIVHHFCACMHL